MCDLFSKEELKGGDLSPVRIFIVNSEKRFS